VIKHRRATLKSTALLLAVFMTAREGAQLLTEPIWASKRAKHQSCYRHAPRLECAGQRRLSVLACQVQMPQSRVQAAEQCSVV
jgi:hypothetical protein